MRDVTHVTDTRTVESRAVFCLSRIRNSQIRAMTSPPPNPGNAQKKPFFLQETVAEYEVAGSLPPAAFFSYQPPPVSASPMLYKVH